MSFYYQDWDDKYVRPENLAQVAKKRSPLQTYKFEETLPRPVGFDRDALPILFQTTPDCLVNLASSAVNKLALPMVYKWSNEDVERWIRKYGYPQYQHTFRENLINGRTLLLVDAAALSAMNIKNFAHIKHIAYGIRQLFHFEMVKFCRSISLPPQYEFELYKLFRVKSGPKYELTKLSELLERYQIIRRAHCKYNDHWDILEKWLKIERETEYAIIGAARHFPLYRCPKLCLEPPEPSKPKVLRKCKCMPPCECLWRKKDLLMPWRLRVLDGYPEIDEEIDKEELVLPLLQEFFPFRYGPRTSDADFDMKNFRLSVRATY